MTVSPYPNGEPRVFEWPCDRRDAHHPHPEDGCPGVGAHPATQIGGSYDEW